MCQHLSDPRHLANLGDGAGLLPDREASTEHLSPGVVLRGGVGGQSDRAQSNQIRVPERDKQRIASWDFMKKQVGDSNAITLAA